ncbi:MAG: hypothetical protein ACLSCV_09990 [Acutalibacteraceae bacterium]
MGYRGKPADEIVTNSIESCLAELLRVISPKCIYQIFPVTFGENHIVTIGSISIQSKNLSQHINGCKEAAIFAATLGDNRLADSKIQQDGYEQSCYSASCAATVIEAYCDEQQDFMKEEAGKQGLYLRPRFSPGYGDFPLTYQKDLLGVLNCQKRIGLTVMDSLILAPSKSVTAVIGLTEESTTCHIARCMTCQAKNCPFRKEE